jgi:hypothetical protein
MLIASPAVRRAAIDDCSPKKDVCRRFRLPETRDSVLRPVQPHLSGYQFLHHVVAAFLGVFAGHEVGKKENFQHGEHYEQFDDNNDPQSAPHAAHPAEPVDIEPDNISNRAYHNQNYIKFDNKPKPTQ